MTDEEKCKFLEETWTNAADKACDNVMRLTATLPGGRKKRERLEDYVKRVKDMQDAELEKYNYAVNELLKVGKHYEEYQ